MQYIEPFLMVNHDIFRLKFHELTLLTLGNYKPLKQAWQNNEWVPAQANMLSIKHVLTNRLNIYNLTSFQNT